MGTDISIVVERRRDDGQWELLEGFPTYNNRVYDLFRLLGCYGRGREDLQPLTESRGWPPDYPKHAPYDPEYDDDNDKSWAEEPSWLTLAELEALDWRTPEGKVVDDVWIKFIKSLRPLGSPDAVRIVYWFSS